MELKTTKLYSEILEKVNSFGDVICKDENGKDCEAIDDFKYSELAQSIEQLFIDKMEGAVDFIHKNYELSGDSGYWITKDCIHKHSTKQLIELYLNK